MKKIILALFSMVILSYAGIVTAKHFWRGQLMPPTKVGKKWGKAPFNSEKFKVASEEERAGMAFSLLNEAKKYQGKDRSEIRKELGDFNGFYFSDMFPAYIIQSTDKETWQIVFLLDRAEKVTEIVVHKNCCD